MSTDGWTWHHSACMYMFCGSWAFAPKSYCDLMLLLLCADCAYMSECAYMYKGWVLEVAPALCVFMSMDIIVACTMICTSLPHSMFSNFPLIVLDGVEAVRCVILTLTNDLSQFCEQKHNCSTTDLSLVVTSISHVCSICRFYDSTLLEVINSKLNIKFEELSSWSCFQKNDKIFAVHAHYRIQRKTERNIWNTKWGNKC